MHFDGKIQTDCAAHSEPYLPIGLCTDEPYPRWIGEVWIDDSPEHEYNSWQNANARRLVQCWNACVGIPNPAALADLLTALTQIRDGNYDNAHDPKAAARIAGAALDKIRQG